MEFCSNLRGDLHKLLDSVEDIELQAKIFKAMDKTIKTFKLENPESQNSYVAKAAKDPEVTLELFKNHLSSEGAAKNTIADYMREADKFVKYLAANKINIIGINITSIEGYLTLQREKRNITTNGYRRLLFAVKKYLKFLLENDYIYLDLAKIVIPGKTDPVKDYLRDEDVEKLIQYLNESGTPLQMAVVALLLNCGLRRQELINLEWENVNFENGEIKILHTKGDKSRIINFGPYTKQILHQYRIYSGYYQGAVIRGVISKRKITRSSLQNMVRGMFKKAKIYREGLTIHSFRHTCATRLNKAKGLVNTSKFLGHSDFETTRDYLHFDRSEYKDVTVDIELRSPSFDEKS